VKDDIVYMLESALEHE